MYCQILPCFQCIGENISSDHDHLLEGGRQAILECFDQGNFGIVRHGSESVKPSDVVLSRASSLKKALEPIAVRPTLDAKPQQQNRGG